MTLPQKTPAKGLCEEATKKQRVVEEAFWVNNDFISSVTTASLSYVFLRNQETVKPLVWVNVPAERG
jgi:hypothetical protein